MKYLDIDRIWAYLIVSFATFFEPVWVVILWMLIFVMVDLCSGIYAAWMDGGHIESNKLRTTVSKVVMYVTCVILLHGLDAYMMTFAQCGLCKIGATIICGIELYSVFENFYRATGNEVFRILTQFTINKIKDSTGVDINGKRHRHK